MCPLLSFLDPPLSDERAQEIIDKALQESSVDMRNIISVLTGLMGSGKTCLLSRIFNKPPPSVYTSTGIAEQSFRGWFHHIGSISSSTLEPFSHDRTLKYLADHFYQSFNPADTVHERITNDHDSSPVISTENTMPLQTATPSSSVSTLSDKTATLACTVPVETATPSTETTAACALSFTTAISYPSLTTIPDQTSSQTSTFAATFPDPSTSHFSSTATMLDDLTSTSFSPVTDAVTSTSSSLAAATSTTTHVTRSETSQSILRLIKAPKDSQSPTRLELIHMIDTGGQPEYMENMPSLIHSCHLAVLVMSLQYDVDDHYHEEGKEYKRALQSQYSNRQIIQKLAATLQAKRFSKEGQCFRLVTVATHRDCLWWFKLGSRIRAYHQALSKILLPACEKELIRFSANEIPFVLNLKKPTKYDLDKLDLIREKISENGVGEVVKTPGVFMIYEQELTEYASNAGRNIVSLEECLEVGAKLRMEPDMVLSALIFFHRQFTFLYFRDVLPNLVFIQPQIPLDCINAIVQFSYKVEAGDLKGVSEELTSSLKNGIITEEILNHQHLSKCFIASLYEPHHAIDLLCHTLTLAPLSHQPQFDIGSIPKSLPVEREKREYLMMSLRQAFCDKDITQYIPLGSQIAPLVVQFTKNCVPLSCFSRTISCLLAIYDWKLSRADDGSPECLAHNIVSLYKPQMPGQIIFVDMGHSIQIHIKVNKYTDPSHFPDICFQVRETVFTAIELVFEILHLSKIEISRAFICPCSREPHNHSASVYQFKSQWMLNCSIVESDVGAAEKKHIMWLDTSVTETMKPSLPKLLQFNVPTKVVSKYYEFGILLLNDEDGCLLDVMENDCLGMCERIVRKILSTWIQGRGKPVTWNALIETLRSCDLNDLADKIHEKMQ